MFICPYKAKLLLNAKEWIIETAKGALSQQHFTTQSFETSRVPSVGETLAAFLHSARPSPCDRISSLTNYIELKTHKNPQ